MRYWCIGLAIAAALASPAIAATEIPSKPGKDWKHKATGAEFPARLAGLERKKVVYFSAPEVDVAADYWSADGNDTITVYFYRDVSANVPVWFDRSRHFILNLPDKYGSVSSTGIRPFTPRGQTVPSGLLESFEIGKGGRSSVLMILPFKGFYAKIRATSKTRDVSGIEALTMEAMNSFDWSSKLPSVAAVPIEECSSPLALRDKAKPIEASGEDRMMAGILGGLFSQVSGIEKDKNAKPEPPPVFCREPGQSSLNIGMYRPNGDRERYILAVLDGGRAITVGRNGLSELINGEIAENSGKPGGQPRYTVSFVQLDKVETYGDFTSLPLPEQATEQVEKASPVSVAGTWGKDERNVTIITD